MNFELKPLYQPEPFVIHFSQSVSEPWQQFYDWAAQAGLYYHAEDEHAAKLTALPQDGDCLLTQIRLPQLLRLETLTISHPTLTVLPEAVGLFSQLKRLYIRANMTHLPDSIANLSALETLYIGSDTTLTLPAGISNLPALETLSIRGDATLTLPNTIGNLQTLQQLNLYSDTVITLPASFAQLRHLSYLKIEAPIESLVPIAQLTALENLTLHSEHIHLPADMTALKTLKSLTIHAEELHLTDSIQQLRKLETLIIDSTDLHLSGDIHLKNLYTANITAKNLHQPAALTLKLPELNTLHLNHNAYQLLESTLKLPQLNDLTLTSATCHALPPSVYTFNELYSLEITMPVQLSEDIEELTQLHYLTIRSHVLDRLPEALSHLELYDLTLDCPRLNTLPDAVSILFTLTLENWQSKPPIYAIADNPPTLHLKELPDTLPADFFALPYLTELTIYNEQQKILRLPSNIVQMTNLTTLYLQADTVILPDNIGALTRLQQLHIQAKSLILPESIGQLRALHSLRMTNLALDNDCLDIALPDSMQHLTQLEHLEIICHALSIPDSLFTLSALTNLDIRCQNLINTAALDNIEQLQELYWLTLEADNLIELPQTIGKLSHLSHLIISSQYLNALPASIADIKTLSYLTLNCPRLKEIPASLYNREELTLRQHL